MAATIIFDIILVDPATDEEHIFTIETEITRFSADRINPPETTLDHTFNVPWLLTDSQWVQLDEEALDLSV